MHCTLHNTRITLDCPLLSISFLCEFIELFNAQTSEYFSRSASKKHILFLFPLDGSNQEPDTILTLMEKSLKTSGLQQDFELLGKIRVNRVQSQQLKLLHKVSRIECVLRFDAGDSKVEESSEIIRIYMTLHPLCK